MFEISGANRESLHRHAAQEYPYECCGVIIGREGGNPAEDRVRGLTNIQDQLHQEDPETYPRDARTAYQLDPQELYRLLRETQENGLEVKAIYHSHPENPVYFSQEDEEKALIWGEPPYRYYLIMSVYNGEVKEEGVFRWEPSFRSFVREEVRQVP